MATLYTHRDSNIQKTWLLMVGFLGVVIGLGWVVSMYLGDSRFLYFAVAFALIMNVYSYWYSDKLVVRMTRAVEADPVQFLELHRIVENLAITAGLPKPRVYIVSDPAPNAFATGRDAQHALVACTTGLLAILDRTELEAVLAHELSHIGNRDMLVSTVAVVLVGFVAIVSDIFVRMVFWGGSNRERNVHPALLIVGVLFAILAPIAATLLQLAISRKREFLADASGALLTRYPEGLASALMKIQGHAKEMKHASHATSHLFIANPFGPKQGLLASLNKLYATHPPVEERVGALRGMELETVTRADE